MEITWMTEKSRVHRVTTSRVGNGFISRKEVSSIRFKKNFPGRMNSVEI